MNEKPGISFLTTKTGPWVSIIISRGSDDDIKFKNNEKAFNLKEHSELKVVRCTDQHISSKTKQINLKEMQKWRGKKQHLRRNKNIQNFISYRFSIGPVTYHVLVK